MMLFTLGARIKNLIQAFKARVLSSQGEFEAETCLDVQLTDLDNKGLLDSASLIVTPNGYKENVLFSVTPSPVGTNLLLRSSEFENITWTKSTPGLTIASTFSTAPNTLLEARTLQTIVDASAIRHRLIQQFTSTVIGGNTYTFSIYAKKNQHSWIQVNFVSNFSVNDWANFDLENGVIGNTGTGAIASIEDVGDGWYRLWITGTAITTGAATNAEILVINNTNSGRYPSYQSTVAENVFDIWGAQLVEGTEPKDYFPVTNRFNIPRLDYVDGCPSILVEPQMTNSWTNNNDTSGYTSSTNAVKGATISNAFGEGFNGFEYNFIGGSGFISSATLIRVFDTRTLPVQRLCLYIKAPSSDFFGINYTNVGQVIYRFSTLEVSNSTIGAIKKINEDTYALYIHTDTAVTGQFSQVRVAFVTSLTDDTNVDGSAILGLAYYQGAATGTTGVQNYNYTPIIAGAGAVTRNGDYLLSTTSAINLIGQTEGTIFLDFDRTLTFSGIKALLTLYSVINDETFHIQTANNGYTTIVVSIVSVANGVNVARSMTLLEGRNKLAVVYSTSGTKIFINGTQLTPLTNTALPVMNTINLSNRTGVRIYGPIRQFSLWKTQITDAQAIQLTTL